MTELDQTPLSDKLAESLSIVIPFRNWDVGPFEVALHSLELQTNLAYEVIVVDIASSEPFKSQMKELCDGYHAKYFYIPLDLPDKAIDVHLWNTCFNWGVRKASNDLIMYSGMDRVYENNMVECVLDFYNWGLRRNRELFFCSKVYNLYRTPKLSELVNFDALIDEADWRGGYGYWGASREWIHKVRGLDETMRWYEDLDLARRAKRDGLTVLWVSHGRILKHIGKCTRVLHLADHPTSRFVHKGSDVLAIASRGRFWKRFNLLDVIRNDEDWGQITESKLQKALELVKWGAVS